MISIIDYYCDHSHKSLINALFTMLYFGKTVILRIIYELKCYECARTKKDSIFQSPFLMCKYEWINNRVICFLQFPSVLLLTDFWT